MQKSSFRFRSTRPRSSGERILATAKRVLIEQGHEAFSLRAVARRAKLAPSSLYEHYRAREDLLEALAKAALRDLRRDIEAACVEADGFASRMLRTCEVYLTFASSRRREFELCFSRTRPADLAQVPAESPLLPVILEIGRGLSTGECVAPPGLTVMDMALSLWALAHGLAVLRHEYLADTEIFADKAKLVVSALIAPWLAPRRTQLHRNDASLIQSFDQGTGGREGS